jgi:glutaminase
MYLQTRTGLKAAALALMLSTSGAALAAPAASDVQIKTALNNAYTKVSKVTDGKNADYIPALAHVDPKIFGIALVTADGRVYSVGDLKSEVSIQSISKVFTMALVLDQSSAEEVERT